jgi:hypothetical protein
MKKCPYCAEDIQDAAIVCKHCHRELNAAEAHQQSIKSHSFVAELPVGSATGCARCGRTIRVGDTSCRHCTGELVWEETATGSFCQRPTTAASPSPPVATEKRSHLFGWLALAALFMSALTPAVMAPLIVLIALACSGLEVKQGSKVFGAILIAFGLLNVWVIADHFGGFSASLGLTNPKQIEERTVRKYEATSLKVPSAAPQILTQKCADEWPNDFRMRSYCEGQQRDGISKLEGGQPSDIQADAFTIMRGKCAEEWPRDFQMRAYCESQQHEGYRSLQSSSGNGALRARCAQQWPDDYRMQQYCLTRR